MELNGTNLRLVHGNDVHILSGSVRSIHKNKETSAVVSNEIGLEANADKTK
jgi:hypothetical protein